MDRAASGEKLLELTWWKDLSVDKLQTKVFDINDNKNQQGSEEISSTTLYKWKKGINFPDIYKLIKLSLFFHRDVEYFFVFNYSYQEIKKKIKSKHKSGTEIHSRIQTMYFEEEDLSIEELKEKYPYTFMDFEWMNQDGYTYNPNDNFPTYINIDSFKPIIDLDVFRENFSNTIKLFEKKFGSLNYYLTTLLNIKNSATVTNWKSGKTIPETETLLTVLKFLQIPFEILWVPNYIWQEKFEKFNNDKARIFECHFFEICDHDKYLDKYTKFLEEEMTSSKKSHPEHTFLFDLYNNYSLDELISLYLDDSGKNNDKKPWDFSDISELDEDFDYYDEDDSIFAVPPDFDIPIGSICDDIDHYLIYRIIKENKKDKYYHVIIKCFKNYSQTATLIEEHSE